MCAVPAGDGVTLIQLEADPAGGITYLVEGGRPRMLQIGEEIAGMRIGVIDTTRFLLLMDPSSQRLVAFCTNFGGSKIYFFGGRFGQWLDESGEVNRSPDIVHRMKSQRLPVAFNIQGNEITVEIVINPHFREAFNQDAVSTFDYRANSHMMQVSFDLPSGKFRRAKVLIQKERGHDSASVSFGVRGFPFVWPEVRKEARQGPKHATPPPLSPPPGHTPTPPPTPQPAPAGTPRIKLAPRTDASSGGWDAADPSADPSTSGRVRLRPRTFTGPEPPSGSPPPPRATILPRNPPPAGAPTDEPARSGSTPDAEAPRLKIRPLGSGASGPFVFRPSSDSPPASSSSEWDAAPASEWIDDLLSDDKTARADETQTPHETPPPVPEPPKPMDPNLQARKKGVITVPAQQLSIEELVERIEVETDAETRWKLIEQNLILGREERTYQLVARFTEFIDEKTAAWPPARLKLAFGRIPGGILFGIMYHWKVNQIMAVAEENPEVEKIMTWLRERELDRMLQLDTSFEITTAEAARRDLCVDKNADEAAIKKTWRTLLSFLNADHGRQDERAIHRKKDEIAKHLQKARNILLRQK